MSRYVSYRGRYVSYRDGTPVPSEELHENIILLCGAEAVFDIESGIGYRCTTCFAMVHSMAMPIECKELYEMNEVIERLKGTNK